MGVVCYSQDAGSLAIGDYLEVVDLLTGAQIAQLAYPGARRQVQHVDANDDRGMGARTVIALFNPDKDPTELVLDGHQVCYVMNEQGQTIDTIRNQKQQRRHT